MSWIMGRILAIGEGWELHQGVEYVPINVASMLVMMMVAMVTLTMVVMVELPMIFNAQGKGQLLRRRFSTE